jgi:hypothetical protein
MKPLKFIAVLLSLLPVAVLAKVGPDLDLAGHTQFFTKLRLDYAKNPGTEYFPMWRLDPEQESLAAAYKKGDVDQVLKIADSWLRRCPVDADSHLRVAMCFKERGDLAAYNYHLAVFYGLLSSITATGDGLTEKTAFQVISVHEEYSLLQEIGATVEKQSLASGSCDKMEISRKSGKTKLTLYFNVAIPLAATAKRLDN